MSAHEYNVSNDSEEQKIATVARYILNDACRAWHPGGPCIYEICKQHAERAHPTVKEPAISLIGRWLMGR